MDVFKLRQHVIDEYADYTKSFLNILDPAIHQYVHRELDRGKLWPDALIQLSPAYDQASTVADLVQHQVLHPRCADIFQAPDRDGTLQSLRLYYHQRQAIDLAHATQKLACKFLSSGIPRRRGMGVSEALCGDHRDWLRQKSDLYHSDH